MILTSLPLLAMGYAFMREARRVPIYTAQVVLQRQVRAAPLTSTPERLQSVAVQDVPSQLEILRSIAVVGDVVDSLGLRVSLSPVRSGRAGPMAVIRTDPDAPLATYELKRVTGNEGVDLFLGNAAVAALSPSGAVDYRGLHLQLAPTGRTPLPLKIVVRDRADAIDALRYQIVPVQVRGTSLIRISYSSTDPRQAAAVLNALGYSYGKYVGSEAREEATRRRQFLAGRLAQMGDSLRQAKAMLANYQQASQTIDPRSEGQAATTALTQAESDLRAITFQEGVLQDLLTSVQTSNPDDRVLQRLVSVSKEVVPAIDDFYRQLRDLDAERSRLTSSRFGYTTQGRKVQSIDSLIAVTRTDMRGATEEALRLVRTKKQAVEQNVARLRGTVAAIPAKATTFTTLQQNVDATQRTYDLLSQKLYEAELSEAVEAGDVEIVDPARVPAAPDPLDRTRAVILALLTGFAVAAGIVTMLDRLDRTIRTSADATRATGLPVLGIIPDFGKRDHRATTIGLDSFRKLRTTLRFVRAKRVQVLAVTSAAPGEGKSVTAANLAESMAQSGATVILIDADLHRPTIHSLFGEPRSPGLSDVLVGEISLEQALVRHGALSLLSCGTSAPNPSELLASSHFSHFIEEVRRKFDTIIIDTPAVHAIADAAIIVTHADGVLLIVRAESTDQNALMHAVDQMRRANADVLGIIMNRVPVGFSSYSSNYGYYEYADYKAQKGNRENLQLIVGGEERKRPNRIMAALRR